MTDMTYEREFYEAKKIIFKEGNPGFEMFIVEEGEVVISKIINKKTKIIATLGKGKIFGEMALIDSSPRMATAEAGTIGATCIKINSKKLESALASTPPLVSILIKTLVENLRNAQK